MDGQELGLIPMMYVFLEKIFVVCCLVVCGYGGFILPFPLNVVSVCLSLFGFLYFCLSLITKIEKEKIDCAYFEKKYGESYKPRLISRIKMRVYKYLSKCIDMCLSNNIKNNIKNGIKIFFKKLEENAGAFFIVLYLLPFILSFIIGISMHSNIGNAISIILIIRFLACVLLVLLFFFMETFFWRMTTEFLHIFPIFLEIVVLCLVCYVLSGIIGNIAAIILAVSIFYITYLLAGT